MCSSAGSRGIHAHTIEAKLSSRRCTDMPNGQHGVRKQARTPQLDGPVFKREAVQRVSVYTARLSHGGQRQQWHTTINCQQSELQAFGPSVRLEDLFRTTRYSKPLPQRLLATCLMMRARSQPVNGHMHSHWTELGACARHEHSILSSKVRPMKFWTRLYFHGSALFFSISQILTRLFFSISFTQ